MKIVQIFPLQEVYGTNKNGIVVIYGLSDEGKVYKLNGGVWEFVGGEMPQNKDQDRISF